MRINRFIAQSGYCSRRNADLLIAEGRVEVNGSPVTELGRDINLQKDHVAINGIPLTVQPHAYYAVNKPLGTVCSTSRQGKERLVTELVPNQPKVFPVGRLDKDTGGLIILTNDGEWAQRLIHPSAHADKEYLVTASWKEGEVIHSIDWLATRFSKGIHLGDGRAYGILTDGSLSKDKEIRFSLTVQEGRHHMVRRMCAVLGLKVIKLTRLRIGRISLNNLKNGAFRNLTEKEIANPI